MKIVNESEFPGERPLAEVCPDACDGCSICVDACPAGALLVGPHATLAGHRMIHVDPALCHGCGVCQATCPKEGIRIPGLSTTELRGFIHRAIHDCHE